MELIRYKPGEALRWLEVGASDLMRNARKKGAEAVKQKGSEGVLKGVGQVAGAVWDMGKGAMAEFLKRQAEASEFVLAEKAFEVLSPGQVRSVKYDNVAGIRKHNDHYTVSLAKGSNVTIKPFAYLVAGRVRVPIGWSRNGLEVPFEVLIDELAARCQVNIVEQ